MSEETKVLKGLADEEVAEMMRIVNENPMCIVPIEEPMNKMVLTSAYYLEDIVKALLHEEYEVSVRRKGDAAIITWPDKTEAVEE